MSSRFRPNINRVREDSSYIYQEYLVPDNFLDVKVSPSLPPSLWNIFHRCCLVKLRARTRSL